MIDTDKLVKDLEGWKEFGRANAINRDLYNEGYFTGYESLAKRIINNIETGYYVTKQPGDDRK